MKRWSSYPERRKRLANLYVSARSYSIEEPSTNDSQTVKSAPQTALVASVTRQGVGDTSVPEANLEQKGVRDNK